LGRRKLARAHSLFEEEIQLCKGAAGWFGHPEVRVNDAQETNTALQHGQLASR
jgi:hypothetical protein